MKRVILNRDIFGHKAAILEDGVVSELFVEKFQNNQLNGSFFKGRVENVVPGIGAAFIDLKMEKNGFLYIENLKEYDPEVKDIGIEKILKVGEEILVQVINEAIGSKGVRVTTEYTIPGKYLVLVPDSDKISLSKKIVDLEERDRLTNILEEIRPKGYGLIVRTQAVGQTVFHFERELVYLLGQWKDLEAKSKKAKVGDLLYKENTLCKTLARDIFGKETDEIILNSEKDYWEFFNYTNTFGDISNLTRIKLYKEDEDIFDKYKVTEVIEQSLKKVVWLDCGGYLVIETTEALTSIDINTGRNVGCNGFENTIFETNMEAAKEIPRQLRLRNIGGIIIIDFIDMKSVENREKLVEELQVNLKKDRIKNEIVHFTDLHLVEMTRKRVGSQLMKHYYNECPTCNGTGTVKSEETHIGDILKEIRDITKGTIDFKEIKLILEQKFYEKIKSEYLDYMKAFLEKKKISIRLEKMVENRKTNFYKIEFIK